MVHVYTGGSSLLTKAGMHGFASARVANMKYAGMTLVVALCAGCGVFGDAYADSEDGDGGGGMYPDVEETDGGETGLDDGAADEGDIEMTTADNEDPYDTVCACAPDNEDIYVMSDAGEIWTFDPDTLRFRFVTQIACGMQWGGSKAMAVSRKGRAWVEYHSGDIHTVDLIAPGATTACMDPGFYTEDPLFYEFGMAFVANGLDDHCERLYLNTNIMLDEDVPAGGRFDGALGVVDPRTLELSRIAATNFTLGELAGTREGRMFAFLPGLPGVWGEKAELAEYNKDSGALLGRWPLPGLGEIEAFSFTFWGGYFFFFTAPDDDTRKSRVTRFDFANLDGDGQPVKTVVAEGPVRVVAATVSTCAPSCPRSWRATCSL